MSSNTITGLSYGTHAILPGLDRETLLALRDADAGVRYRDVDVPRGTWKQLKRAGLVVQSGTEYVGSDGKDYKLWTVPDAVQTRAGEILGTRSEGWPRCDHRFGIVHDPVDDPGVGDFKCPNDRCDERYTRETVERVRQARRRGGEP